MPDCLPDSLSPWLQININTQSKENASLQPWTYPKFVLKVEGIQQFDNVMVVAGGQDVNLHHVVFQFIFSLCVNNLGRGESPILFVLGLKATRTTNKRKVENTIMIQNGGFQTV